jgi:hypothetical protein
MLTLIRKANEMRTRFQQIAILAITAMTTLLIPQGQISAARAAVSPATKPWLGLHVLIDNQDEADHLVKSIPNLKKIGVNVLIAEVDYSFQFRRDPKMFDPDGVTWAGARAIGDLCRANGIRIVPEINCLGHQSWAGNTGSLLTHYPQLDETPGKYPKNEGIYCRSWCPSNPDTNRIVFSLIDDLIDAFGADAFHVGMDEVFIMASNDCPLCRGKNPADLFAKQVNDLHVHLVNQKKVEMLMWGDRLLDSKAIGQSKWEASDNGTAPAVDHIPTDIIICDWHYDQQADYKSIAFLLGKGFRVWPSGFDKVPATQAFLAKAIAQKNPQMLGYLSTTWGKVQLDKLADFQPTIVAEKMLGNVNR